MNAPRLVSQSSLNPVRGRSPARKMLLNIIDEQAEYRGALTNLMGAHFADTLVRLYRDSLRTYRALRCYLLTESDGRVEIPFARCASLQGVQAWDCGFPSG